MNDPDSAKSRLLANNRLLEDVAPVVRAILIRKSGMTLAGDDQRLDNVDALDLYHDVLARLWERLADAPGDGPALRDLKGYAAATTYNAWSDYLREKYPQRASLKNRLRYFLGHQPKYAVWENAEEELVGGYRKWQLSGQALAAGRIAALRDPSHRNRRLPPGSVPRKSMEQFGPEDWGRLLDALFEQLGGPASIDDLVGIVAALISLEEVRVESIDHDDDAEASERVASNDITDSVTRRPDQLLELQRTLRQLWVAILALRPEYRAAYLLNIPGPGKSRGDIEVFALHGVASIEQIGAALALSSEQYALLWGELALAPTDRSELATLSDPLEHFCLLWKHLPIADALIGRLLGLAQQQVINRRMLALRELARALVEATPVKAAR